MLNKDHQLPTDTDSLRTLFPKFNRNFRLEYNCLANNPMDREKRLSLNRFAPITTVMALPSSPFGIQKFVNGNWRIQEESVETNYTLSGFVLKMGIILNITSLC